MTEKKKEKRVNKKVLFCPVVVDGVRYEKGTPEEKIKKEHVRVIGKRFFV